VWERPDFRNSVSAASAWGAKRSFARERSQTGVWERGEKASKAAIPRRTPKRSSAQTSPHCTLTPAPWLRTSPHGRTMDKVTPILIEALRQAAAEAGEQRLYKSGKLSGLFPGRAGANAEAAAQALRDGLLEVVRTETKGKTTIEWVRVTPKGVEFLHNH